MPEKTFRVSADIGGTFTDLVFQDVATGRCIAEKVLSTPQNPALAVLEGLGSKILDKATIDFFVHGTTVGLNAVLTRRGAKVALLTTENYRDIYTIQGNDRRDIFSIRWRKPKPLVTIPDTFTARERINAKGEVEIALDTRDLDPLVAAAKARGYEAIAICFLFGFKNASHELAAEAYLREKLPGVSITLSHRVSPEWREYARTSTAVMQAYVAPVLQRYLNTLVRSPFRPPGRGEQAARHGIQRRRDDGDGRGARAAADAAVGPGRRRHRRPRAGGRDGPRQPHLRRHGRHLVRRQPDRRRRAVGLERSRA